MMENKEIWESNLKLLRERPAAMTYVEPWLETAPGIPESVSLHQAANGLWTAGLPIADGSLLPLHSCDDPLAEARLIVQHQLCQQADLVVVAGTGLGYAALVCAESIPVQTLLVILSGEPQLFWLSMSLLDWQGVLKRPNLYLVIGSDAVQVRKALSKIAQQHTGSNVNIISHPILCQLRKDFYGRVFARSTAQPWWDYPKLQQEQVKVLLVSLRHLLLPEIKQALVKLGHHCNVLLIGGQELDRGKVERMFNEMIQTFRPDFVLTINHLGFDQEGVITDLLTRYRLPFASWYVDSPHLIIRHYARNRSPYLTLFLWDKDYIGFATQLGFDRVFYLPLATDTNLFRPMGSRHNPFMHLAAKVSFVGNSMIMKVRSVLERHNINGLLMERFEEVSAAFLQSQHLVVRNMMEEMFPDLALELADLTEAQALGYEAGVTWQATGWYRQRLVEKLEPFHPLIVGDPGWSEVLGSDFQLHRELNYYSDLAAFYNVTKVSFNATSRQMKECVNQRVFDVPACRRVLLTDWTYQLEALMEPGREVLAYHDQAQIPELAERALKDRKFYQKIAANGYRRVQNEHTYCHRLKQLIAVMREHYGS